MERVSEGIISDGNVPLVENAKDTINIINQWIQAWKDRIKDNEKAKVKATLLQNYSFHAGSNVEYSESYSTTRSHTSTFHITVGVHLENEADIEADAGAVARTSFAFEESVTTTHGGEFESDVNCNCILILFLQTSINSCILR